MYRPIFLIAVAIVLQACASIDPGPLREQLTDQIHLRSGYYLPSEDQQRHLQELLAKPLNLDSAVRIGLLNSPEIQQAYRGLEIAQADFVQAGLISNPVLHAELLNGHDERALDLGISQNFLSLFLLPAKKRLAKFDRSAALEELTATVIGKIGQIKAIYIEVLAAKQLLELETQIQQQMLALAEVVSILDDAGNLSAATLARYKFSQNLNQQNFWQAEANLSMAREQLNVALGLWGNDLDWQNQAQLPALPATALPMVELETMALQRNLQLEILRLEIQRLATRLDIDNSSRLIPDLELGWSAEREDGAWSDGPALGLAIPVFDTGRARKSKNLGLLAQAQQQHLQQQIAVRAAARNTSRDIQLKRRLVEHWVDNILPDLQELHRQSFLRYNAMQIDLLQLIEAMLSQDQARRGFILALRDYWLARGAVDLLSAGINPDNPARSATATAAATGAENNGGH